MVSGSRFELGEPLGEMHVDGKPIEVFERPADIPEDSEKAQICEGHMLEGRRAEMMNEFWFLGVHFPETGQEQVICLQFSCPGQSKFRERCRLKLAQYDTNGKQLTEGSLD
jgi:hypothetical protein